MAKKDELSEEIEQLNGAVSNIKDIKAEVNDKPMLSVTIPITECDVEMFKELADGGSDFDWTYTCDKGQMVNIIFTQGKDDE